MAAIFKIILSSLLLISLMVVIQCGKPTNPEPEYSLVGDWVWVQSVRDFDIYRYSVLTPESENKYKLYEFHDDSSYSVTEIISDGMNSMRDSYSGTYYFTFDTSSGDIIHLAPHRSFKYKLAKDSLFLTELCCERYKQTYVRIEE